MSNAPNGREKEKPSRAGEPARRGSAVREAVLSAAGITGVIVSAILAPLWVALAALAGGVAFLALVYSAHRRPFAGAAAVLVVGALALAIHAQPWANASSDQGAAESPDPLLVDEDLSDRIDERVREIVLAEGAPDPIDDIPIPPLAPLREAVIEYVNRIRERVPVPALAGSDDLTNIAQSRAARIAASGRLAHEAEWIEVEGWAENLAFIRGDEGAWATAVRLWASSPAHRENLVGAGFARVGVGIHTGAASDTRGLYVVFLVAPKE